MRWVIVAAAVLLASRVTACGEEEIPERIRAQCAAIEAGHQAANWKRNVDSDKELEDALREIENVKSLRGLISVPPDEFIRLDHFADRFIQPLAKDYSAPEPFGQIGFDDLPLLQARIEKAAAYAQKQFKKQRGTNGRDKWQAEFSKHESRASTLREFIRKTTLYLDAAKDKAARLNHDDSAESKHPPQLVALEEKLAEAQRSTDRTQTEVDKLTQSLARIQERANHAAEWLAKQRTKKTKDEWQAKLDRENEEAQRFLEKLRYAQMILQAEKSALHLLTESVASVRAAKNAQGPTGGPYRAEAFRKLREDGSFRQGDDYFRIGEVFFFEETVTKDKAAEMRDARKRGGTADWDNLAILQVLDKESVLTSFRYGLSKFPRVDSTVFLMRGIDTSEIREKNLATWYQTGTFIVAGTHRYETTTGRLNTVFVVEPFDAAEVKKWWPAYQAEKKAK